ncbi:MAG: NAD-dependent epimerase/dehydratase family protein [Sulfitobacter sp.]
MADNKKSVLILGGDGFTGWPLSLLLSKSDYDVTIVDNYERRRIDAEIGVESLTQIRSLAERLAAWTEVSGKTIASHTIDLKTDYAALLDLFANNNFDAVVHLAEQKSAPFSMKSAAHRRETLNGNTSIMSNLLNAMVETGSKAHLVHLGTMGVYGYGTIDAEIPEGYLDVKIETSEGEWEDKSILYPPSPGSIYHLTKCTDHLILAFYQKVFGLRCTDLHQGIVWGSQTDETSMHPHLANRLDYDSDYGTVLNRFIVQGAAGAPLTVYGSGGQTRAFIHIRDTIKCIKFAIDAAPSDEPRVRVFNQTAQCLNVRELAERVARLTGSTVRSYENPRMELAENDLRVKNAGLQSLGWEPLLLEDSLISELIDEVRANKDRVVPGAIPPMTAWRKDMKVDRDGTEL